MPHFPTATHQYTDGDHYSRPQSRGLSPSSWAREVFVRLICSFIAICVCRRVMWLRRKSVFLRLLGSRRDPVFIVSTWMNLAMWTFASFPTDPAYARSIDRSDQITYRCISTSAVVSLFQIRIGPTAHQKTATFKLNTNLKTTER